MEFYEFISYARGLELPLIASEKQLVRDWLFEYAR